MSNSRAFLCAIAILALFVPELSAQNPALASNQVVVLTVENDVQILRAGARDWDKAYTNQILHAGDRGRTYENSRVTLRMHDQSIARFNENSLFQIESPPDPREKTFFSLLKGMVYFFHRQKPSDVKINTPSSSAAIRGTEFTIQQEEGRTILNLVDGEVALSNLKGETVTLKSQEQGIVEAGKPPAKSAMIEATNIIQWCLYYPAILDLDELRLTADEKSALAQSLEAYRSGDLLQGLARYPAGRRPGSAGEKIYLGALLLAVGQVQKSEAWLNQLDDLNQINPEDKPRLRGLADALRRLILAVNFNPTTSNAQPSTLLPPFATSLLADSYYQQAQSRLEAALVAARKSVAVSPKFGFGWARVAELEFSFGHLGAARAALARSLELAPRNAQALALQGFLASAQNQFAEAISLFDQAIAIDGALGNAWLGRGLCRFHRGEREAGRADLQTAAALEPNRSILRSYLGKAWSQLGKEEFAEKEWRLAKKLDPHDPTPWLYSALEERQENRINPAVDELEKSIALNDNRSIYRSRLFLDEDRAVRAANLANIYQAAGMTGVSVREAARSVNDDYGNYSAHLFLAESFDALRDPTRFNLRYETVWFNERLLANLLAPVGAGPVSQNISQQEYFKLFDANRIGLSSVTDYRSDGQVREGFSQFGTLDRVSYAFDLDYQHNDGIRPNNKLSRLEWYTTLKQQLTPDDSVLLLTKFQDYHSGDNFQYYDWHQGVRTNFTFDEYQNPIIVAGYHHQWAPGVHTLLLGGRLVNDQRFTDRSVPEAIFFKAAGNPVAFGGIQFDVNHRSELEIYTGELNQIFQTEWQTLILGGRFQTGEFKTRSILSNPSSNDALFNVPPADTLASDDLERGSAYGYYTLELPLRLRITGGASYDHLQMPENFRFPPIKIGEQSRHKLSPKAALVWSPLPELTLRGIYTRSLGGVSLDESFRLEPAQLAGFSQAFRTIIPESVVGSVSAPAFETWGAAADLKFKTHTYVGIEGEILESTVRQTIGVFDYNDFTAPIIPSSTPQLLDYHERSISGSIDQLLGQEWSVGAQYRFSSAELNWLLPLIPTFRPDLRNHKDRADLQQLNLHLLYNHPSGIFARAESQCYWQRNLRASASLADDSFAQLNVFVGYRFPHQHAAITLGVLNITGGDYRLNPLNVYPELPRKRVFAARLLLNF